MAAREQIDKANAKARELLKAAGIVITEEEAKRIEYCDYHLGEFDTIGTEILTYVNTDRVCAKEMMLTPYQICPEHLHPQLGDYQGKEETFRCRWGTVYLYVDGEAAKNPQVQPPEGEYTVFHEIILHPGEQYTILPNTRHWFQAGAEGAVVSEFSTHSTDENDIFTDGRIIR